MVMYDEAERSTRECRKRGKSQHLAIRVTFQCFFYEKKMTFPSFFSHIGKRRKAKEKQGRKKTMARFFACASRR